MKAILNSTKESFNVVHVAKNIVIVLDPSIKGKDQRRMLSKSEVTLGESLKTTQKPKKRRRRKRMNRAELLFSNSPVQTI